MHNVPGAESHPKTRVHVLSACPTRRAQPRAISSASQVMAVKLSGFVRTGSASSRELFLAQLHAAMVAVIAPDQPPGCTELLTEGQCVSCPPQVARQSSVLASLAECSADRAPVPIPFAFAAVEAFCFRMPKSGPGTCPLHQLEVIKVRPVVGPQVRKSG